MKNKFRLILVLSLSSICSMWARGHAATGNHSTTHEKIYKQRGGKQTACTMWQVDESQDPNVLTSCVDGIIVACQTMRRIGGSM